MATNYDLSLTRGVDFSASLTAYNSDGSLMNLSGYSAKGYIKYKYSQTGRILDMHPQVDTSYVSGIINIALSGVQTTGLPIVEGLYDVIVTNGIRTVQALQGYVEIFPDVSY
jgi:hypothetical protein